MSTNEPVGNETNYSKVPFEDNVAKSIPPAVPGSEGRQESSGDQHAHGGRPRGSSFSDAKKMYEKTRDTAPCNRSPW